MNPSFSRCRHAGWLILATIILSLSAFAEEPPHELAPMVIVGTRSDDLLGVATTSNEGTVGYEQLRTRPILRPGEIVETIPGVIVTQHAGGGKANQFFLRGFNLDHGTDLATSLDGMPINMPTHAHGQGYTDLNVLIPELVREVNYKKGPYFADVGDFGSAGAFDIRLFDTLPNGIASVTGGTLGYIRTLLADSQKAGAGSLLYAFEYEHEDGPWRIADGYQKYNGVLKYSVGTDAEGWSITAMGYKGSWHSSDQAPRRAMLDGFPRYNAIDDTTGGDSQRYSALWQWHRDTGDHAMKMLIYGSYYDLDLFSNFTYFLDDPIHGDQFEQHDRRIVLGAKASETWRGELWKIPVDTTLGLQVRNDNIRNGLWHTERRERLSTTRYDHTLETSVGVYAENKIMWTPWLRSVAGVRGDYFDFHVHNGTGGDSGSDGKFLASPKLSLVFGPWAKTEFYLNGGLGFHSNDARGVTNSTAPATPLVRTKGAEAGLRTEFLPGLTTSLTAWMLDIDSELVFSGDAGDTEASRPSRRYGLEFANFWTPAKWLTVDADFALSHARFRTDAPEGRHIPGSIQAVLSAGVAVHDLNGFFGGLRLRYFGPRDLIEDGSKRSDSSTLLYAQAGYEFNKTWSASVEVFNVFGSEVSDIDYFYTSRLRGEPDEGVDDFHTHPAEPRSVRFTVTAKF